MSDNEGLGPNIVKRKLALRAFDVWIEKAWHMALYVVFFVLGFYAALWSVARANEGVEPCKVVNVCSQRDGAGNCVRYSDITNPAWNNWKLSRAANDMPEKLR